MVGFLLAIPGMKPGGSGLSAQPHDGRAPGVSQRRSGPDAEAAAARRKHYNEALKLVEWTFDPLELKNAFFNIERLGAIVRRYVLNQYGTTIQPSARRTADGPLRGGMAVSPARSSGVRGGGKAFRGRAIDDRDRVPGDIAEMRRNDPKRAREIQRRVSESS